MQYKNHIDGKWVKPVNGECFENISPVNIAGRIEGYVEELAVIEAWDNGKSVRETLIAYPAYAAFGSYKKVQSRAGNSQGGIDVLSANQKYSGELPYKCSRSFLSRLLCGGFEYMEPCIKA